MAAAGHKLISFIDASIVSQKLAFSRLTLFLVLFCTSFAEDWWYHETMHCTEMYSLTLVRYCECVTPSITWWDEGKVIMDLY